MNARVPNSRARGITVARDTNAVSPTGETALEAAWEAVLAQLGERPAVLAALVQVLDHRHLLDDLKARVLREAAAELRGDLGVRNGARSRRATANGRAARWLHHQLL